jgi:hypothetical protein
MAAEQQGASDGVQGPSGWDSSLKTREAAEPLLQAEAPDRGSAAAQRSNCADGGGADECLQQLAPSPPPNDVTMDVNHPLLQRAQRALKQQLEARKLQLEGELKERQNALKVLRSCSRRSRRGCGGRLELLRS